VSAGAREDERGATRERKEPAPKIEIKRDIERTVEIDR